MVRFIDMFYVPKADPRTPYRCFVWQGTEIVGSSRHTDLDSAAEWCKRQGLPVRVYNAHIQGELLTKGIAAHLSDQRAVGQ